MSPIPLRAPAAASAAAVATVLLAVSGPARADITKAQCAEANIGAQDLRRDGQLAAAREQLRRCADPACPAIVRDDCTRRLDDLDKVQPTIAFEVKDASGSDVSSVKVTMDGKAWSDNLEGKALPADPGKHSFTFQAAGQSPVTRTFVITEGEKGRRERIVLDTAPAATPPAASPARAASPPPPPSSPSNALAPSPPGEGNGGIATQKVLGLVVAGLGVVGLGVGSAFGLMTTSAWNDAKTACGGNPSQCTDVSGGQSKRSSAEGDATLSTVGFVAGGVLLAAGAVLFLTAPGHEGAPRSALTVVPAVGPTTAGIDVRGAF